MVRRAEIPFLLRLVDDESETVREAVIRRLDGFGQDLGQELDRLGEQVPDSLRDEVWMRLEHLRGQDAVLPARFERFEGQVVTEEPRFQTGQVVSHRREGFRGVIVEVDDQCMAQDDWYQGQDPRPPRHQPWFHVLVDRSDRVAYVDQTSLEAERPAGPVRHPMLEYFFAPFAGDAYERNERPWPPA